MENLTEDSFEVRCYTHLLFISTRTGQTRRAIIEEFESPLIISCKELLQDVSGFLRKAFSNRLSESHIQSLTSSHFTSQAVRTLERGTTSETAHRHPRLMPLPIYFPVVHQEMNEVDNDVNLVPASKEAIASLKKFEVDCETRAERCTICLQSFDQDDDLSEMPCEHIFHNNCIVRWLKTSHICPLCRFQMPVD
ncbi:hypothetical protein K1719_018086 [Acacia pycnantha]|nr:hypothetical protein K1719_018086 [Acacia pycnantha]